MQKPLDLERPLACLDIESTGTDPATARIVSLAVVRLEPPLSNIETDNGYSNEWLFNPGVTIPESAWRVHGIKNEHVVDCPSFAAMASEIKPIVSACDLLGYNLRNYDIPLLWEEFFRARITWNLKGARVIDACQIFRKKEPRDLTAALKKYCGEDHSDAHDALADVRATIKVLLGQRRAYEDIGAMDVPALAALSCEEEFEGRPCKRLDLTGKIVETLDDHVARFTIGKVRGKAVADDPGFAEWMLRNDFPESTKLVVRKLLGHL